MRAGDWLRLAGLSGLWGGSFLFYRMLAGEIPPLSVVLGRVAFGAVGLVAILAARGRSLRVPRAQWGRIAVFALFNNAVPFTLFAWAETRIGGGTAAILNAMTPLFTALTSAWVWRTERLTVARLAGVACGLAGVAVLVGPQALLGQDIAGQAACLLAALCYGVIIPYGRRIAGLAPHGIALGQMLAATAIMLPLALLIERPWTLPSPSLAGWGALLGLAVLSTTLAYLIFFDLLARAGATNLTLVTFLVPVSALLLGALVLDEAVGWTALAGMALIACGLAAIDGRLVAPLVTRLARGRARRPEPAAPR